jgi:hypothetical protein
MTGPRWLSRALGAPVRLRSRITRAIEARLIDHAGPVLRREWSVRLLALGLVFEFAEEALLLFQDSIDPEITNWLGRLAFADAVLANLKGCK